MTRWSRLVLLGAVLLCAAACGKSGDGEPSAAPKPAPSSGANGAPPPAAVKVVTPELATRSTTLETSGKVQFNEENLVRVHAPATGRVLEILARPGDVVEPGQRLFVLDSSDLGLAKSDYAKAVADVERGDAALKLSRELFEVKAIAQKEVREAENEYRKAVAERERAAARLATLGIGREQLANIAARTDAMTTIIVRTPRAGVVVERNVAPGQVVAFGQSDTPVNLFTIADLSTMWVVADVYEPDVPRIQRGQRIGVALPCCPNDRYEGTVSYISDSVDPQTRTVKVRAVVPNRNRALKNEMFVKVTIGTATTQVLTLPQSALHRENGQAFVLVEKGKDDYERRPVTVGADLDGRVEIRSGVTVADRVAAEGSILLKKVAK
ncbi:MAG: efflux RND transporter periplasmic adaptor subunit [Candidatus Rokubacteria bacterium]|nr:efflux RND transporter periplasmic adaptor subunit [Candidatus Rokubacteria bacterium]